ncbi:hypothetical protein JAO29_22125 [Edaphobacter sp. HDX4]|uniref:Dyp-type peroxidase n=1 Tax=Edaphobacter sp. HDX4 TaxID=2794064 RepID=UPI002FE66EB0
MSDHQVDFQDVQGIVRFGYGRLTEAVFLLLNIRNAQAARAWLRHAPISNAVACEAAPLTAMQIAFTCPGLRQLGVKEDVINGFSIEFRAGMANESGRSRLLGDTGSNAPERWEWGGPGHEPHILILLYAQPGHLNDWIETVKGELWDSAFELVTSLSTTNMHGVEPFGFSDGLSHPMLDWEGTKAVSNLETTYTNLCSLGEFLLGYPNEYGHYTERPLLKEYHVHEPGLFLAPDVSGLWDLGRNGSYLVARTLEQDVSGFWKFVSERSQMEGEDHDTLASAMVGRKRDGTPLVPLAHEKIEGIDPKDSERNQFTFDEDAQGTQCPMGAHIRRANPRNADMPTPPAHGLEKVLQLVGLGKRTLQSDAKASTRFHRLLRRGREYGVLMTIDEALAVDRPPQPSGIHFMCIVANIGRQFEFLQNAWLMNSKFDAMTDEADPLLGNREPISGAVTDRFSRPQPNGLCKRITGMPQFVTVRGGAYFFLPSLSAIRYFASLETE